MSNLLPENKKKELRQDYFLRLAGVAFVFVCSAFVFAIAGLLPSYFATIFKAQTIEENLKHAEQMSSGKKVGDTLIAQAQEANTLLPVLETWFLKPSAYQMIADAVTEKVSGVALTSIVYNRQNGKILLSGVAKKRDDLIALKNGLAKSARFKDVELPVSDLAHKENLPFTITLTIAQP